MDKQTPNFGQKGPSFNENVRPIRPAKKLPVGPIAIALVLVLIVVFFNSFVYVVAEDELAVVKVFNETKRVIVDTENLLDPTMNDLAILINAEDPQFVDVDVVKDKGLFFKIPFITKVEKHSSKLLTYISNTGQVTTKDKVKFEVRLFAQWEIIHPGIYATNYGSEINTSSKIDETLYADIISLINNLNSDDFLTDKGVLYEALEQKKDEYNEKNMKTGIIIHDLEIYRVAIPASNYSSVYNKMNAERNAVAAGHRADGQKIYAETISDVDLQVSFIEAAAIETAAQIQGEADATSVQIYADAFSKDPEFYEFWRSLQAYENSIDANTTIYLDKNNPFLKYFSEDTVVVPETETE